MTIKAKKIKKCYQSNIIINKNNKTRKEIMRSFNSKYVKMRKKREREGVVEGVRGGEFDKVLLSK